MARTLYYTAASIDGPGNWMDWLSPCWVFTTGGRGDQNVWLAGARAALAQVEQDTNFVFLTYTVRGSAP